MLFSVIRHFLSVIHVAVFFFVLSDHVFHGYWNFPIGTFCEFCVILSYTYPIFGLPLNIANIVYVVQWLDLNEESKVKTLLPIEYPRMNWCVYWIISNYWMRLSRIWRILEIEEGVIYRGRGRKCVTPSEICRILHILAEFNNCFIIHSK